MRGLEMWDYDHMGWMMNGWGMGFGFILWLVILAVIIAGIDSVVCPFAPGSGRSA
jgi:Na+-transporting methylmalonyl-CoA/oxaloacetate decarboxylase gamma subunit